MNPGKIFNSVIIVLLGSCLFMLFFSGNTGSTTLGYKPVYAPSSEAKVIKLLEPREIFSQGKIYIKDQYIFIGDVGTGVHVIDNSDPHHPQKIAFIQIYGNHDIAIKDNIMYADNLDDLVALDLTNLQSITVTKRIAGVYKMPNQHYPEDVEYGTWFECADPDQGIVVEWLAAEIEDPDCRTTFW
jgi:hypothetical protein